MKQDVKVEIIHEPPAIGKPQMMGGIRSKAEAERWAEKNGYKTVYLWINRQRVYADKHSKKVDA